MVMNADDLAAYLRRALPDNYKEKMGREIGPNEFSVSTLVEGPKAAVRYHAQSYASHLFARDFNPHFFRGTAVHELVNERLTKTGRFEPGTWEDSWLVREEISTVLGEVKVYGHPDISNTVIPIVCEFKTFESEDMEYRKQVLKKAMRQVGFYANLKSLYDGESYQAFVVIFDFVRKIPLSEYNMEQGWGLRNGVTPVQLTQEDLEYTPSVCWYCQRHMSPSAMPKDWNDPLHCPWCGRERKYGWLLNDPIVVYELTPREIHDGYEFVCWTAREAWKLMQAREKEQPLR